MVGDTSEADGLLFGRKKVEVLAGEQMEEGGVEDEEMSVNDVPCCSSCLS